MAIVVICRYLRPRTKHHWCKPRINKYMELSPQLLRLWWTYFSGMIICRWYGCIVSRPLLPSKLTGILIPMGICSSWLTYVIWVRKLHYGILAKALNWPPVLKPLMIIRQFACIRQSCFVPTAIHTLHYGFKVHVPATKQTRVFYGLFAVGELFHLLSLITAYLTVIWFNSLRLKATQLYLVVFCRWKRFVGLAQEAAPIITHQH